MSVVSQFLSKVQAVYSTGEATEHSYRSALEFLFNAFDPRVKALNEPKRVKCGAPDFIIQHKDLTIGHVEAKDIPVSLKGMKGSNKEQLERYRKALPNLVYTNCLDFHFYRNGDLVQSISIADLLLGIQVKPENFDKLENLLREFIAQRPQTISSPKTLAEMMAGKAGLIKEVLANALTEDIDQNTELTSQYNAFKQELIHDIKRDEFADIYAETIAYGMFAARLHDESPNTFNRVEALELLPKSNPFLRSLFGYIAGPDLDERLTWIIDDLAAVFQAADVKKLMQGFGRLTGQNDPFLHFYETFLSVYNPAKRKARGVWYTPESVVNFIVRAVDDVLQTEFALAEGLADTSKVSISWDTGQKDKKGKPILTKKDVHKVQILDPATGTGTFLAEAIKQIAPKVKNVAEDMWSDYIEADLVPRLHGFELLMASYAMCHMKLDMILTELGYKPTKEPPRLSVFLTNSLEEGEAANQTLPFAQWLANEVKQANTIKRDMPIMCVIGNPPYSGISQNMGDWIVNLIDDYKYVEGKHFGERKHWLHDDYVKFIRLSEYLINKNGEGIIGFITNHGYIDNPTFRGMRFHLLNTFDKIYVINLHGNSKKKEVSPDGTPDKNVFDIQQGVAIILGFKSSRKKGRDETKDMLNKVAYFDLWGSRETKYSTLRRETISSIPWKLLTPKAPYFMFYDVDYAALDAYDAGFSLSEFFVKQSTGIITARDNLTVDLTKERLCEKLDQFFDPKKDDSQIRREFFGTKKEGKYLPGDSRGWKLSEARKRMKSTELTEAIRPILYRPFDRRWIVYDQRIIDWPRAETMENFEDGKSLALLSPRMTADNYSPLVTNLIVSNKTASRYDQSYFFPLYVYADEGGIAERRVVNLDRKLFAKLQNKAKNAKNGTPTELEVFDYIYGVLHCLEYRT